jgi:hypothetical protein
MRQALNNPIVVGILCLVAVVVVYWRVSAPSAYSTEVEAEEMVADPIINAVPAPPPPVTPPPPTPAPVLVENTSSPPPFSSKEIIAQWEAEFSRDPFKRVASAIVGPRETSPTGETNRSADSLSPRKVFQLQAISIEGRRRFAVINHQVVTEGETLEGSRLVKIHADGVVFSDEQGEHQVEFGSQPKPKEKSS